MDDHNRSAAEMDRQVKIPGIHGRKPFWWSRSFWFGLFGLLILLGAWSDSSRWNSTLGARWNMPGGAYRGFGAGIGDHGIFLWAGRPYQGLFNIDWTGVRANRIEARKPAPSPDSEGTFQLSSPIIVDLHIPDRPTVGVHFWLIVVLFLGFWYGYARRKARLLKLHAAPES